jgi:hypothetical protein
MAKQAGLPTDDERAAAAEAAFAAAADGNESATPPPSSAQEEPKPPVPPVPPVPADAEPAPAPTPEPEPVDPHIASRLAALVSKGEQAQQARTEATEAEKRAQDILDQANAKAARAEAIIEEFARDPLGAYEKMGRDPKHLYERAQRMALDKDGTRAGDRMAELEKKLDSLTDAISAKLDEKIAPLSEFREQEMQARQAAENRRTALDFVEYVGRNQEKFKYAAALEPNALANDLSAAINLLQQEGAGFTYSAAAAKVNEHYEALASRLSPLFQPTPTPPKPPPATTQSSADPKGLETLTNATGAAQAHEQPETVEDRMARAIAMLERAGS